jgi:16S rRNA (guanine(966)-N(2))-methyltransferase RsmD
MRVISGKYKGKKLDGFDIEGTRPTMDRVKESLFGSIQNYVKDSIVLDLFAGSGSLGIEALSMGANKCYFVDNNKIVINVLNKNLNGIDNYEVIKNDYKEALNYFKKNNIKFDLILLDPPYKFNLINSCIELIHEYDLLNEGGIIVCEFENENVNTNYYEELKRKKIATKCLVVYKRAN